MSAAVRFYFVNFCAYFDYFILCYKLEKKLVCILLLLSNEQISHHTIHTFPSNDCNSYAQFMSCLICCFHEENKLL